MISRHNATGTAAGHARTFALIAAAGIACYAYFSGILDPELLAREAADGRHWSLLLMASFVLMLVCAATPLPAEVLAVANGLCFGPLAGAAVTWASATAAAAITFACSRHLLRRRGATAIVEARHPGLYYWLRRWGRGGLLLARLMPMIPFFTLNFAAALLPISLRDYLLITAIAILPHAVLFSVMGSYLR